MKLSNQILPPGGWQFKQGEYWLRCETREALIADVTAHRKSNGIKIGNVEKDIEDQLEEKNPSWTRMKRILIGIK